MPKGRLLKASNRDNGSGSGIPFPSDMAQFTDMYHHHVDAVYAFMHHYARNHFEAEDLTADVFERALRYFPTYDSTKSAPRTWLFAIAHNVVRQHTRLVRRRLAEPLQGQLALAEAEASQAAAFTYVEEKQRLHEALSVLRERELEVIALRFGGDLSNKEIAVVMGLSDTNVRKIVSRSLQKLSRSLT